VDTKSPSYVLCSKTFLNTTPPQSKQTRHVGHFISPPTPSLSSSPLPQILFRGAIGKTKDALKQTFLPTLEGEEGVGVFEGTSIINYDLSQRAMPFPFSIDHVNFVKNVIPQNT
jgi:hypothetical protein